MIEFENLHKGDKVWYGNIEFSTRTLNFKNITEPGEFVVVEIGGRIRIDSTSVMDKKTRYLHRYGYGRLIGSSLYSDREELVEDWNCVIESSLDLLKEKYFRTKKELKKLKAKVNEKS